MKSNWRWQLLLTAVCLAAVWVLLSYQEPTPAPPPPSDTQIDILPTATFPPDELLCTQQVPGAGGELVEGVVGRPQYPNPLLAGRNPVDRYLVDLVFDGLTRYNRDGDLEPSLAESWSVSEDGRSITFTLRGDGQWHDGQPVTTADVAYTYGLLQQPAAQQAGLSDAALWQNVNIEVVDGRQIRFNLADPYAPFLEATTRGILPNHLLNGTDFAGLATHPINQQPVGTGPFVVQNNWATDGAVVLLPNVQYWGDGVLLNAIQVRFYASDSERYQAFLNGEITALGDLPSMVLGSVMAEANAQFYTTLLPRYTQLLFNLDDTAASPIQELAVRQSIVQAVDKSTLLASGIAGQGIPFDGPYLPNSFAYDPNIPAAVTTNVISASDQLTAAGWVTLEGASPGSVREKDGEQLQLRLLARVSSDQQLLADFLAEMVQQLGVQVDLSVEPHEIYQQRLESGDFDMVLIDISPAADPDLYDFWSQEAIVRGQNYGYWNNRRASEALEAARQLWNPDERNQFYRAFLQFYQEDVPALTLYQHVSNYAVSEQLLGVDIGRVVTPRDRYLTFPQWHTQLADQPIPCDRLSE